MLLYAHQLTDAVGGMVVVLPTFIILALPIALVLNVRRPHANLDFRHPYLVYAHECMSMCAHTHAWRGQVPP